MFIVKIYDIHSCILAFVSIFYRVMIAFAVYSISPEVFTIVWLAPVRCRITPMAVSAQEPDKQPYKWKEYAESRIYKHLFYCFSRYKISNFA